MPRFFQPRIPKEFERTIFPLISEGVDPGGRGQACLAETSGDQGEKEPKGGDPHVPRRLCHQNVFYRTQDIRSTSEVCCNCRSFTSTYRSTSTAQRLSHLFHGHAPRSSRPGRTGTARHAGTVPAQGRGRALLGGGVSAETGGEPSRARKPHEPGVGLAKKGLDHLIGPKSGKQRHRGVMGVIGICELLSCGFLCNMSGRKKTSHNFATLSMR